MSFSSINNDHKSLFVEKLTPNLSLNVSGNDVVRPFHFHLASSVDNGHFVRGKHGYGRTGHRIK
jgi:hypothetical protein